MSQPEQLPAGVPQPQITPIAWEFGTASPPGMPTMLVLVIHTVIGKQFFFMSPSDAKRMAAMMVDAATTAEKPSILTPANVLIGPDGQPIVFAKPSQVPTPPQANAENGKSSVQSEPKPDAPAEDQ